MNRTVFLTIALAALVLLLQTTSGWSAAPPNPTDSDANLNTAGGTGALDALTTGESNTAFGWHALNGLMTGDDNTAIGSQALDNDTSGSLNTAYGRAALLFNSDGIDNTASGAQALQANTSGDLNSAMGADALGLNTAGSRNTGIGHGALYSNTTASDNTATGFEALYRNTTGNGNTASGVHALFGNTTGRFNTASGYHALLQNSTGSKNTALGQEALRNSTGDRNIAIGYGAGGVLESGNNNIYLGHAPSGLVTELEMNESLIIRLGSNQTSTFIAGIAATAVNDRPVTIDADGKLGTVLSSARSKRDIASVGARSTGVHELRPVRFAYREDAARATRYGLIAEEVAVVYPELVTHTPTGEVQTVRYHALLPLLLDELQRQERDLRDQQHVLEQQQRELGELRALVEGTPSVR